MKRPVNDQGTPFLCAMNGRINDERICARCQGTRENARAAAREPRRCEKISRLEQATDSVRKNQRVRIRKQACRPHPEENLVLVLACGYACSCGPVERPWPCVSEAVDTHPPSRLGRSPTPPRRGRSKDEGLDDQQQRRGARTAPRSFRGSALEVGTEHAAAE